MPSFRDARMTHEQVSSSLAEDIVQAGYVSYQQARTLGFVPTPQSLYTVIVTTIRDIHHPDAYNVAYLLGWCAAHYQTVQQNATREQHLQMAALHLRLASALDARKAAQS